MNFCITFPKKAIPRKSLLAIKTPPTFVSFTTTELARSKADIEPRIAFSQPSFGSSPIAQEDPDHFLEYHDKAHREVFRPMIARENANIDSGENLGTLELILSRQA